MFLLILIIAIIELYIFTRQVAKSNLDSTINDAENDYEIMTRLKELEDKVDKLEEKI